MYKTVGPPEGSIKHRVLEKSIGYSYRTLLGECMYAYITCRPDIGYAVTTLLKFSCSPSTYHYRLLKGVAKYLRSTIHWGMRFRHSSPLEHPNFEPSEWYTIPNDNGLAKSVDINRPLLIDFVDAAHANDLRRRQSTTGLVFTFCGGAVFWRSKTQLLTAGSSTEAEFFAAYKAGKVCRFLRMVMKQLGYEQQNATSIYIDNMPALQMINKNTAPTENCRHVDIRYWALQDWVQDDKSMIMRHICGSQNVSDDFTKPLGYVLHSRHCRRLMVHYT